MEILEIAQVTKTAWWLAAAIMAFFVCGVLAIIFASNDAPIPTIIFTLLALIALVIIVIAPSEVPTDQMSYTVEITDPTQYQTLVEKGYTFKRLFENKEIYTIIGDVLK